MATKTIVWEGASIGGEASRPEKDFAGQRAADAWWHSDLIREEEMDDSMVSLAEKYGLLPAGGDYGVKSRSKRFSFAVTTERQYSRERYAERKAQLQEFVKRLK
jgi:hypothetical protein